MIDSVGDRGDGAQWGNSLLLVASEPKRVVAGVFHASSVSSMSKGSEAKIFRSSKKDMYKQKREEPGGEAVARGMVTNERVGRGMRRSSGREGDAKPQLTLCQLRSTGFRGGWRFGEHAPRVEESQRR